MSIKISDYSSGYKVVSLVKDEADERTAISRSWDYILFTKDEAYLMPNNKNLLLTPAMIDELQNYNSLDVFEITENGLIHRIYDTSASDNAFFVTGKCNSNCIMCPASDSQRKNGIPFNQEELLQKISHIPYPPEYLTITGGEPFLPGKQFFPVLQSLRDSFPDTNFQILTNGRIFANLEYCKLLQENIPDKTEIGIPVHGPNADLHDYISQVPGSFHQTFLGLKHLLSMGFQIEIRIVASALNCDYMDGIADLIINEFHNVTVVRIMGLEMMGNAAFNRDRVWLPYRDVFLATKNAAKKLILSGIDVSYYNFPLCSMDREYWSLGSRSISGYKVRYADGCEKCIVKSVCGGFFQTSLHFAEGQIHPVEDLRI